MNARANKSLNHVQLQFFIIQFQKCIHKLIIAPTQIPHLISVLFFSKFHLKKKDLNIVVLIINSLLLLLLVLYYDLLSVQ